MRCPARFAAIDYVTSRGATLAFICVIALAGGSLPCAAADTLVDVSALPRLGGAAADPHHSASDDVVFSVAGSVSNTVTAIRKLFVADGWKQYVTPSQ